jgi:pilus assembly protein CpaE
MSTFMHDPESLSMNALSVVLVCPNSSKRQKLSEALAGPQASIAREFGEYPTLESAAQVIDAGCDVVIVDLDSDPEQALDLVESICSNNSSVTVMIVSSRNDSDLLVRCMRAGARELLAEPVRPAVIAEALVRASARRSEVRRQKKVAGKMLVFAGSKGGSGVTTIASNFALALAKESRSKVVLVDLDLHLGDATLALGMTSQFSIADAVKNANRLDIDFLSTLLTKHSSGLHVLAAPDKYETVTAFDDAGPKILRILREDFAYVVVDAGSNAGRVQNLIFELADTLYFVTQVNIPSLRNANRLIRHLDDSGSADRLEVVVNRYDPRKLEIDESGIAKALTVPVRWKVPNDYASVARAQNTGVPIALEDSAVSRALTDMARTACGKLPESTKKRKFGIFG